MEKKILIAEDEVDLSKLLKGILEENGFNVLIAKNGYECIKISLKEHPDIILLDIIMPQMDGLSALDEIRKDEWGKNVQVILLTNINEKNAGVVDMVAKDDHLTYLVKSEWGLGDIVKKIEEVLDNTGNNLIPKAA